MRKHLVLLVIAVFVTLTTSCGSNVDVTVPSVVPTTVPTITQAKPTLEPIATPVADPTIAPTTEPVVEPTVEPTAKPVAEPTVEPTAEPVAEPTAEPTAKPVAEPTVEPTAEPVAEPTTEPTEIPVPIPELTTIPEETITPEPAVTDVLEPSLTPTPKPTIAPTQTPTASSGIISKEIQIAPMSLSDLVKSPILLQREIYFPTCTLTAYEEINQKHLYQDDPYEIKSIQITDKATSIGVVSKDSTSHGTYILADNKIYFLDGIYLYKEPVMEEGQVGSVTWIEDDIYLEAMDLTIPRLKEFNTYGNVDNRTSTFVGDYDSDGLRTLIQTIQEFKARLVDLELLPRFEKEIRIGPYIPATLNPYISYFIEFIWHNNDAFTTYRHATIQREVGYEDEEGSYYLMVHDNLHEDTDFFGVDRAPYNKEITILLLSTVSSTPEILYDFIYRDIYDTAIYGSSTEFVPVGDCAIRFAGEKSYYAKTEFSDTGYYTFYYQIKKNPTVYELPTEEKTDLATTGNNKLELRNLSLIYPKLNYFNSQGLKKGSGWFGNVNAPGYLELQNETITNLSAVKRKLMQYECRNSSGLGTYFCMSEKQIGFTISEDKICWYWDEKKTVPTLMIERVVDKNMYRVTVNTNLHSDMVSVDYDQAIYTREILEIMLSLISSTPEKLLNHIYCGSCWTSDYRADNMQCGDSIVSYDEVASNSSSLKYHYVFEIREAK